MLTLGDGLKDNLKIKHAININVLISRNSGSKNIPTCKLLSEISELFRLRLQTVQSQLSFKSAYFSVSSCLYNLHLHILTTQQTFFAISGRRYQQEMER